MNILKPFKYSEPRTVEEAVRILSQYSPEAVVLAGGTDLLVLMKKKYISPAHIIYIQNIPLNYIHYTRETGLKIGATTTLDTVSTSKIIKDRFTSLSSACKVRLPTQMAQSVVISVKLLTTVHFVRGHAPGER